MPLWTGQPLAYPAVQKTGAAAPDFDDHELTLLVIALETGAPVIRAELELVRAHLPSWRGCW